MKVVQCCALLTVLFAGHQAYESHKSQEFGCANKAYTPDCRGCMNLDGPLSVSDDDYLLHCCADMVHCYRTLLQHGINPKSLPHFLVSQGLGQSKQIVHLNLWDTGYDDVDDEKKTSPVPTLSTLSPQTSARSSADPPSLPTTLRSAAPPSFLTLRRKPPSFWPRPTLKPTPAPSTTKPLFRSRTLKPGPPYRRPVTTAKPLFRPRTLKPYGRPVTLATRRPTRPFTLKFRTRPTTPKPRPRPRPVVRTQAPVVKNKGKNSKGKSAEKRKGIEKSKEVNKSEPKSKGGKVNSKEQKNGEGKCKEAKAKGKKDQKSKKKPKSTKMKKGRGKRENRIDIAKRFGGEELIGVMPMIDGPVALA